MVISCKLGDLRTGFGFEARYESVLPGQYLIPAEAKKKEPNIKKQKLEQKQPSFQTSAERANVISPKTIYHPHLKLFDDETFFKNYSTSKQTSNFFPPSTKLTEKTPTLSDESSGLKEVTGQASASIFTPNGPDFGFSEFTNTVKKNNM